MSIYSVLSRFSRADFGSNLEVKRRYTAGEKLVGFLVLVPPVFLLITPLNAASAVVLSINGYPSWQSCLLGFLTVALAAGGVNTLNRYVDRERDKTAWPNRAIPAGRVKAVNALLLTIVLYAFSLLFCWLFLNLTTTIILLIAIILGSLYSSYLRDSIGYLSLPPIVGLIYLGGWAAFSPQTLFSSFLPWYLYLMGVVWQTAHIMTHYVLHISSDSAGKPVIKTPAFFFKPSTQVATYIGFTFTLITFVMAVILSFTSNMGFVYLTPVVGAGAYTLWRGVVLLLAEGDREKRLKAWGSLSTFRLVISAATLLSVSLGGI